MPTAISKLRTLTPAERRLAFRILVLLPCFAVSVRCLGFRRTSRWLDGRHRKQAPSLANPQVARHAWLVDAVANRALFPASCLTRSLVLRYLLGRAGVETSLLFGVRLTNGGLEAHCWVEYENQPINDAHNLAATFTRVADPVATAFGTR